MVVNDLLEIRDRVVSVWTGSHCTCWWNIWKYEEVMWRLWLVGIWEMMIVSLCWCFPIWIPILTWS